MAFDTLDPILSEAEYRVWLGISAPTAQRQRSDGSGPPFIQLSQRRIARWLSRTPRASRLLHRLSCPVFRPMNREYSPQQDLGGLYGLR